MTMHHQTDFVDQVVLDQRLPEHGASVHQNVAAVLALKPFIRNSAQQQRIASE